MCEFCTKHGDGKVWYKNAANFSNDLLSDLKRRQFIEGFLETTIRDGFNTLGRLEVLYNKRGRLPGPIIEKMEERARIEHFGQVLPIEEIRELIYKSDAIVRMPCACRWTAQKKEVRCCYGISLGPEAWYKNLDMGYFGRPHNEGLESTSPEEALARMEEMEDHGAIHTIWTMVTPFIGAICNCTARDCIALRTLSGIGAETMARAEYVASIDGGLCNGCGLCEEQCQFGAIDAISDSGSETALIDPHKCFGCGLCRRSCNSEAISLLLR